MPLPKVSVVLSDGCSIGSALAHRLSNASPKSQVRQSPMLSSWDELSDLCQDADVVYLMSALGLRSQPADQPALEDFRNGVTRVLECCQECGVSSFIFTSSASVVADDAGGRGLDLADENRPFVAELEDPTAHAIALAEAEVLKASGTQNLGGSSCLYTCALRPAAIYGAREDRSLQRALWWVGFGLNRLAVSPKDVQMDMVHVDNLVEAHVQASAKLMDGHCDGKGDDWGTRGPVSSGQAYFVTDGLPCSPQAFMDEILEGLDFPTVKFVRLPTVVAFSMAWFAELACKVGLGTSPFLNRTEVATLTTSRTYSIARAQEDLGYEPSIDRDTAVRCTVESLRRDGWHRHTFLVPALAYWICNPVGIYLFTLAGFGKPAPKFLAPLVTKAEYVGLLVFKSVKVEQTVCWVVYVVHVLEALYAYRLAQKAGHRDTAPLWFLQTFILGFPSLGLIWQLLS